MITALLVTVFAIILIIAMSMQSRIFRRGQMKDVMAAYAEGAWAKARTLIEEQIVASQSSHLFWLMGQCSLQLGDTNRALSELKKSAQINHYDSPEEYADFFAGFSEVGIHTLLRDIYHKAQQDEQVFLENQILMRLEPENHEHPMRIARDLIQKKDLSERTSSYLQRVIDINPDAADAYILLGWLALQADNHKRAEGYAKRVLEINADLVDARYILGEIQLHAHEPQKAAENFAKSVLSPNFQKSSSFALARIHNGEKNYNEAEAWALRADNCPLSMMENPSLELESKYLYARICEMNGKPAKARELYQTIVKINPTFKDAKLRLSELGEATEHEYLKDFITAKPDYFLHLSEKIINEMSYIVSRIELTPDGAIIASGRDRSNPPVLLAFFVRRNFDLINEDQLRKLKSYTETSRADLGLFLTTGDYTNNAKDYAYKNKIQIFTGSQLESILARVIKSENKVTDPANKRKKQ